MLKHSFDPMRNDDGSLSIFRIFCLGIIALCMFLYGSLTILGCSDTKDAVQRPSENNSKVATDEASSAAAMLDSDAQNLQAQVVKAMQEAVAYYRECGAINKGFEGCHFEFPQNILEFYEASAQAADDGFTVRLKSLQESKHCALYETDISGVMRAFDSFGQSDENCLK